MHPNNPQTARALNAGTLPHVTGSNTLLGICCLRVAVCCQSSLLLSIALFGGCGWAGMWHLVAVAQQGGEEAQGNGRAAAFGVAGAQPGELGITARLPHVGKVSHRKHH